MESRSISVVLYLKKFFIKNNFLVQNSNETNPSFIELTKAESKKSLKIRKNMGCCDYGKNCYTMCCLNGRQKLEISPDESKDYSLLIR